ncbi:hypothetical protein RCH18_000442 [Flavobacterium sp. PL11]|uniref:DUF1016 N-terminal domain-containing protein n=1 Tax=Flavobacterium sp. PL11 TaxID=3071717 RepID=UPI002DFCF8A4|nr:hypothetical protein [Flavobacterium sp. PL11]
MNNDRADYGMKLIPILSIEYNEKFGVGFNRRNLQSFIKLYNVIRDLVIVQTEFAQLSWSLNTNIIYINNTS